MADVKDGLEFFERGVRMLFDVGLKFLGIERAPTKVKAPRRLDLGTASLQKFHDPFP